MSAPKSFKMAAKATPEQRDREYEPRDYRFVSATEFNPPKEEGKKPKPVETVVTAHYPGDGVMTLMIASMGADSEEADAVASVFAILEASFNAKDYRFLRQRLKDEEISVDQLMDVIADMMEAWLGFPTQPASDSHRSQQSTGMRSTGRAPGAGSTQPASLPAAS